jgi:hypothetical protein
MPSVVIGSPASTVANLRFVLDGVPKARRAAAVARGIE